MKDANLTFGNYMGKCFKKTAGNCCLLFKLPEVTGMINATALGKISCQFCMTDTTA